MAKIITCEWTEVIGEGPKCPNVAVKGRSYCEDHVWLIYQKGTKLGARKKDAKIANVIKTVESDLNEAAEELLD